MTTKEEKMSVPKEIATKYIDRYFSKKYHINQSRQPHFWEAVIMLCSDLDSDISSLIIEHADWCIDSGNGYSLSHYSTVDKNAQSVSDIAVNIAKQIIECEQNEIPKVEFFLMQKDIEALKSIVSNIYGTQQIYG